MDIRYWLVAGLAIILIAVSKAGFGGGPGVLATPIMTTVCSPTTAVAVMLPLMLLCDVWVVYKYRRACVWELVIRLLVGFVGGVLVATYLLAKVPGQEVWLKKVIGGLSIIFGCSYFALLRNEKMMANIIPQKAWFGLIMGIIAGISSTLAHAAGPPVAMYLMSQGKGQSKEHFMGTIVVYTLIGNTLKIPAYIVSKSLNAHSLALTWPLIIVVPIGLGLGWWLNKKMTNSNFQVWVNALLIIIGLFLLFT